MPGLALTTGAALAVVAGLADRPAAVPWWPLPELSDASPAAPDQLASSKRYSASSGRGMLLHSVAISAPLRTPVHTFTTSTAPFRKSRLVALKRLRPTVSGPVAEKVVTPVCVPCSVQFT